MTIATPSPPCEEVMHDSGGPVDRASADAKLDRYAAHFAQHGFTRWVVCDQAGAFLGYTGVMTALAAPHIGPHFEIGWRYARAAWGNGYATEAARAALDDAFVRVGLQQIYAYTGPDNARSQAVMSRLGLLRDEALDFNYAPPGGRGLVWRAR